MYAIFLSSRHYLSLFLLGFSLTFAEKAVAQAYNTAAGLRWGTGLGMSLQQKVWNNTTIQGIAQRNFAQNSPTTLTALVERHHNVMGRAINAYMGVGGHRTWRSTSADNYGVDGIIGLEGTLFYLNTSLDYKPALQFYNNHAVFQGQIGVSLRYVLVKAPYKKGKNTPKTHSAYETQWL